MSDQIDQVEFIGFFRYGELIGWVRKENFSSTIDLTEEEAKDLISKYKGTFVVKLQEGEQ